MRARKGLNPDDTSATGDSNGSSFLSGPHTPGTRLDLVARTEFDGPAATQRTIPVTHTPNDRLER